MSPTASHLLLQLESSGYRLDRVTGVWARPEYGGIDYSDGDEVEVRIRDIIAATGDRSVLSSELQRRCTDWPSLYHLSSSRANLMRPFAADLRGARVLEIGAGCGAISRYLGEAGAVVLALEGSPRRAEIARLRTADLPNVTVVAENVSTFETAARFDFVTLIGVLEYATLFSGGASPSQTLLGIAERLLAPGGRLIVAIENKYGLKYFAGAPEDHLGEVMAGIEDRYGERGPRTFGRAELVALLRASGLKAAQFLLPLPDYKLPVSILTESALQAIDFDAATLAARAARRDPQLSGHLTFSVERTWPGLFRNGLAGELANSFLVVAAREPGENPDTETLAYHYSTERIPDFCKETRFERDATGRVVVATSPLATPRGERPEAAPRYAPASLAEYVHGRVMADDFVDLVTRPGWEMSAVLAFFDRYRDVLWRLHREGAPGTPLEPPRGEFALPGSFFDLVPGNLIHDPQRGWVAFDREWWLETEVSFDYLVFRSLVNLSGGLTLLDRPAHRAPATWGELLEAIFHHLGLRADSHRIEELTARDNGVKGAILGRPTRTDFIAAPIAYRASVAELRGALEERKREVERQREAASHHQSEHQRKARELESRVQELAEVRRGGGSLPMFVRGWCVRHARRLPLPTVWSEGGLQREARRTGLFDPGFYLRTNPDVAAAGLDPWWHYLESGWREGRDPAEQFSTSGYLELHPDIAAEGLNPLAHYLRRGRREGRPYISSQGVRGTLPPNVPVGQSFSRSVERFVRLLRERPDLPKKFLSEVRRGGIRHALRLMRRKISRDVIAATLVAPGSLREEILRGKLRVVPYYTNPHLQQPPTPQPRRIGIHLHVYYLDMVAACIGYLRHIPVPFDLYVSVPGTAASEPLERSLRDGLPRAERIVVEQVVNRGRDIAPFIVQFGARLAQYDYVAHFHTKKSPHRSVLAGWFDAIMETLCGSASTVSQILHLLDRDGLVVFPVGNTRVYDDETGWGDNGTVARDLLVRHTTLSFEDYPYVEYPQGAMFWAKASALAPFLSLPLTYDDFPTEPIAPDGTLAHALERLILLFAAQQPGRNYQLGSPALSWGPQDYFEEQLDLRARKTHETVKVLAYYLPQFHPTPENDAWHGVGFTEWYKVRGATPLFEGHYQQHIPHPDIGYYHLDSVETLRRQAEMMARAGVHGLIFYHYWFSGRLILEKPAQLLRDEPSVDLPYCFCWANENWTRRWDGNEREILLKQVYSPDDARAFIRYLIPFFKDPRYIRVEERPVLLVYRPASLEGATDYLAIWREECAAAGLPAPFVVATLTRGATTPKTFGMDAAVERPLHDWTDGAVPELRPTVRPYWPINGSILDYSAVADHYMGVTVSPDFPLFRSLIPVWDNTPRYGSEAYIVHNFSPRKMQQWLEHAIRDSEARLPADRRFIVVNAWNEWAEGAHLEPDCRYGYAYLNSVGRALADIPFDGSDRVRVEAVTTLRLSLLPPVEVTLARCEATRAAFLRCLEAVVSSGRYRFVVESRDLRKLLKRGGIESLEIPPVDGADELVFEQPLLFPVETIDALVQMAWRHRGFTISAQPVNNPAAVFDESAPNFSIGYAQRGGLELRPRVGGRGRKLCGHAPCFHLGAAGLLRSGGPVERVTTVIRYHRNGDRHLLFQALFALAAQTDCRVRPWLALQDVSAAEAAALEGEIARLPFDRDWAPVLRRFSSTVDRPDRRAELLKESLREIGSGLVHVLDYDDVIFPDAYKELSARLRETRKNATFGRVYSTTVDSSSRLILRRERIYDWGQTWADFFKLNIAPIHSFLLDLDRIDLGRIESIPDMKYLEDYYLTLQIFSPEETDWSSLKRDLFIGDYITRRGSQTQTLAIDCPTERGKTTTSAEFQRCERHIAELKARLAGGRNARAHGHGKAA